MEEPKIGLIDPQDPPGRVYMTAEQIIEKYGDMLSDVELERLKNFKP